MKRLLVVFALLLFSLPAIAQEDIVACTDSEMTDMITTIFESDFLLQFQLLEFTAPTSPDAPEPISYVEPIFAVRDAWLEFAPELPECAQGVQMEMMLGQYVDQITIQIMTDVIFADHEDFEERATMEKERLQLMDAMIEDAFAQLTEGYAEG